MFLEAPRRTPVCIRNWHRGPVPGDMDWIAIRYLTYKTLIQINDNLNSGRYLYHNIRPVIVPLEACEVLFSNKITQDHVRHVLF